MRSAIAAAEVGDEQRGLDPTTRRLQERVARLVGHEAALFLPSGTMCNEIALRLHVRPGGDEVILDRSAHPVNYEAGGPAQVAGAMIRTVEGEGGIFTAEQLETIRGVLETARAHDLRAHLDGARLMNAVVVSGVPARDYAGGFDTAWIDFTKGLGAPVGAVLAGSSDLIEEAWRWKQMLGGAFRQSGIVAAGCLYALEHHVERLAEDHENARVLAEGLAELSGVRLDPASIETNIVIFEVDDAPGLVRRLADRVELQAVDVAHVRAVTHLDVTRADIEGALSIFAEVLG
jgi:threonine aldolase